METVAGAEAQSRGFAWMQAWKVSGISPGAVVFAMRSVKSRMLEAPGATLIGVVARAGVKSQPAGSVGRPTIRLTGRGSALVRRARRWTRAWGVFGLETSAETTAPGAVGC